MFKNMKFAVVLVTLSLIFAACSREEGAIVVAGDAAAAQATADAAAAQATADAAAAFEVSIVMITQTVPTGDLFMSPVLTTSSISGATTWIVNEPGVLLDATATFDRGSTAGIHYLQCPEGGFAFASLGGGDLQVGAITLHMPFAAGTNHLVLVRCQLDDGVRDSDLNVNLLLTGYVPANISTSPMPAGAYVSADWFMDQLEVSAGVSDMAGQGGNCGASGCSTTFIHLIDLDTGFYQEFQVNYNDLFKWELVYTNAP